MIESHDMVIELLTQVLKLHFYFTLCVVFISSSQITLLCQVASLPAGDVPELLTYGDWRRCLVLPVLSASVFLIPATAISPGSDSTCSIFPFYVLPDHAFCKVSAFGVRKHSHHFFVKSVVPFKI